MKDGWWNELRLHSAAAIGAHLDFDEFVFRLGTLLMRLDKFWKDNQNVYSELKRVEGAIDRLSVHKGHKDPMYRASVTEMTGSNPGPKSIKKK